MKTLKVKRSFNPAQIIFIFGLVFATHQTVVAGSFDEMPARETERICFVSLRLLRGGPFNPRPFIAEYFRSLSRPEDAKVREQAIKSWMTVYLALTSRAARNFFVWQFSMNADVGIDFVVGQLLASDSDGRTALINFLNGYKPDSQSFRLAFAKWKANYIETSIIPAVSVSEWNKTLGRLASSDLTFNHGQMYRLSNQGLLFSFLSFQFSNAVWLRRDPGDETVHLSSTQDLTVRQCLAVESFAFEIYPKAARVWHPK